MVGHGAEAGGLVDVDARTVLCRDPAGYKRERQRHPQVRSHDSSLAVLSSETTAEAEHRAFLEKGRMVISISSKCQIEVRQDSGGTAILI